LPPKKLPSNQWLVDIRPSGRDGRRFRKQFPTRSEAIAYEKHILATHKDVKPWQSTAADKRTLSQLVDVWYELHGQNLRKGKRRLSEFARLIEILGNPVAKTLTTNQFAKARAERLKTVKVETANRDLTNLCSVYNELRRLKEIDYPNPLADLKKLTVPQRELSYLSNEQIETLISALDGIEDSHARITARICLSTGARWGEAATVKASQVANNKITFISTKNNRNRTLPIDSKLADLILAHAPLLNGLNTFKRTVKAIGLDLPEGQMTHVLRHTFASHYMINGGDIRALAKALDHSDINLTMRYAHLAPDHMGEVLTLNPLSTLGL